jgi:hypothetical protein
MRHLPAPEECAPPLELSKEERIRILYENSTHDGDPLLEAAPIVHRAEQWEAVALACRIVVRTSCVAAFCQA